jgi:hypothetical protein
MTSPSKTGAPLSSGLSKMSTSCWVCASWLWNRSVNGSAAGAESDVGSNAMFAAASVTTGRSSSPPSPSPATTASAMPPASMATPATPPTIAPSVEIRTCLLAAANEAAATTPIATTSAVNVAAVGVSESRILESPYRTAPITTRIPIGSRTGRIRRSRSAGFIARSPSAGPVRPLGARARPSRRAAPASTSGRRSSR